MRQIGSELNTDREAIEKGAQNSGLRYKVRIEHNDDLGLLEGVVLDVFQ